MARIKSCNTAPEFVVRSFLHRHGYRYRIHVRTLPGRPDMALRKYRTAIFVNGCFWHGHRGCTRASVPKSNSLFWRKKITGNAARDRRTATALRRLGWTVLTVWQCQLRKSHVDATLARLLTRIEGGTAARKRH